MALFLLGCGLHAAVIEVDCNDVCGKIRPLHGVNNGPLNFGQIVDLSECYRQIRVPLVRLHDCEWPSPEVVDIHAVFPCLDGDPDDPASYRFSQTDDYIRAIVDTGAQIVYRLGESIETGRIKQHVHPPADYQKWTQVCLGIIRHYSEGWANGFRYDIRYWEIWNEPENRPNMWSGTDQDYYRLYAAAAKQIKSRFPALKVGGPSIGDPGKLVANRLEPSPFLKGFLDFCRTNKVPLDFFSWHTYSDDPHVYLLKARALRKLLDEKGFHNTEMHLNEWNFLPDNDWTAISLAGQGIGRQKWFERIGGAEGAAFAAYVLMDLQDSPVDAANYYSGDINLFGMFNRYGVPRKNFYAMKAISMLLETPHRVHSAEGVPGQWIACAGMNPEKTRLSVLISWFRSAEQEIELRVKHLPCDRSSWELFILDAENDLMPVRSGTSKSDEISIAHPTPAPTVLFLRVEKNG
ncbi:MAG: hypothetical protein JW828_16620 [Sedimentisphaerales bacterium]|nr:hypothetical protein [Sedimentisphaerales bacterium]